MKEKEPYSNKNKLKLIFSGGGTGGHIYPALAVADMVRELRPEVEILFIGAKDKMEMVKVPQAGYKIIGLWISGLQRKLTISNLLFPVKVIHSFFHSNKILEQFKPDLVAGFGGYASSPIMMAASKKGIKTLIQEQNSYAGIANKAVAGKAESICVAYDHMDKFFPAERIVVTGNPVRKDITESLNNLNKAFEYFELDEGIPVVLILGGSLGARTINESIIRNMKSWIEADVQVLWQTGKLYNSEMNQRMEEFKEPAIHLLEFIDRMDFAYAVADVVVSRAGALSISELCLVKKPVIFVPSPNVAEDHQTKNAMALVEKNAALVVEDKNAVKELANVALQLLKNGDKRAELSENISGLGKPNATYDIASEVLRIADQIDV